MTSNTYWDWFLSKAYIVLAAQAIVADVPRDVRGVPAAPEGRELHDRPGAREDGGRRERRDAAMTELASWNDTADARGDRRVRRDARRRTVPPEERVAVFDNDGTLWCEKPMPIELGFILERLAEMAEQDASLRERQPWKAAYEKDYAWLGGVITKHYAGDDSDVKVLIGGILQAFAGRTVDDYVAAAGAFIRGEEASDARTHVRRLRLPADDRAPPLPGGERIHVLHRLRRRP